MHVGFFLLLKGPAGQFFLLVLENGSHLVFLPVVDGHALVLFELRVVHFAFRRVAQRLVAFFLLVDNGLNALRVAVFVLVQVQLHLLDVLPAQVIFLVAPTLQIILFLLLLDHVVGLKFNLQPLLSNVVEVVLGADDLLLFVRLVHLVSQSFVELLLLLVVLHGHALAVYFSHFGLLLATGLLLIKRVLNEHLVVLVHLLLVQLSLVLRLLQVSNGVLHLLAQLPLDGQLLFILGLLLAHQFLFLLVKRLSLDLSPDVVVLT